MTLKKVDGMKITQQKLKKSQVFRIFIAMNQDSITEEKNSKVKRANTESLDVSAMRVNPAAGK